MTKQIEKPQQIVEAETSKSIVAQNNQVVNIQDILSQAINSKVPVETMERLLAMGEKMQAIKAKQEFDAAMSKFQSECPTITKTKEVHTKSGQVAYKYAPIESIIEQVKVPLQNNGFSYSTQQEMLENGVKVSVKVTHIVGHSEVTTMTVPLGSQTQIMNNSQVVAAASTFAKRYAFLNAFGIMTGDEDNDGVQVSTDGESQPQSQNLAPSEKQMQTIKQQMQEKGIDEAMIIQDGFPPLKDLTGGREGTASELIGYLFKFGRPTGFDRQTDVEKVVAMFTKDLDECTTVEMYDKVSAEIKIVRENGKLPESHYPIILKTAKVVAKRIQDSLPPLETKPKSDAAQAMLRGIAKGKQALK